MKLTKILNIQAQLRCVTGLHIGAGDAEMHIGGIDSVVIRNPITQRPYIPGSSIKGKIRSLLEWRSGAVKEKPLCWSDYGSSNSEEVLSILRLFGTGGSDKLNAEDAKKLGPTRLAFWDCDIDPAWSDELDGKNIALTEAKSENSVNRITGTAEAPRYIERVTAGTPFRFRLTAKVLEGDSEEAVLGRIFSGMKLLEMDSLGGSGSRGYGKIRFESVTVNQENRQEQFDAVDPFAV